MKPALPLVTCLLACLSSLAEDNPSSSIAGTWKGTLEAFGQELPVILFLQESATGKFSGEMMSPTKSMEKIPLSLVSLTDRDVKISVETLDALFKGKFSSKTGKIRGDWTQGEYTLPLDLERSEEDEPVLNRPQNPKGNPPYQVEEVTFLNKYGPHRMAGTLTIPKDSFGPVAAVVLVSGSGPQDRDETILGHKPFLVLADYLTRKGIAVLRYDDRGVGKSEGDFETATHMDFATDAWAAVEYLTTRREIDRGKIGIIGHSEGGLVGPIVATKRDDIAFLVLLAGPGLIGSETILTQAKEVGLKAGLPGEFVELNQKFLRAVYEEIDKEIPDGKRLQTLAEQFQKAADGLKDIDPSKLEGLKETVTRDIANLESPWLRNFIRYDPGPVLEQISCPVLALIGERDLQVLPKLHLPEIEQHLKQGGNENYRVLEVEGANHLFQEAESGLPAEYGKIEETISPKVLKLVAEWIESVTKA